MRKVKVAAIQPGSIPVPETCDWTNPGYRHESAWILNQTLMKKMTITFDLLETAGHERCDIVTTCEDSAGVGLFMADASDRNLFTELVEMKAPLMEKRFSEIAVRHAMYVVGCYYKRIGEKNCNVAGKRRNRTGITPPACSEHRMLPCA